MSALSPDQEAEYARIVQINDRLNAFTHLVAAEMKATPEEMTQAIAGFVALLILANYGGTPHASTCCDQFFKLVSSGVEQGNRCMQQRAIQ